ncbi:hypothetical protein IKR20_01405 [bacterium]|nr:hypothetical protein [bacterium]
MKKFIFLLIASILFPLAAGAKQIGPAVSVYRDKELKWEDGSFGYHVMFKSLLANNETDASTSNPQGDTCMDSSTYQLGISHIPADAVIEEAFLVWTAAQPVAKKDEITDKEVMLSFVSDDGKITEEQTISGKKAYKINEAGNVDFEFDAFFDADDQSKSWFTYRVRVTDFFKSIQAKGRDLAVAGTTFYEGDSLMGRYTLSGLDCSDDTVYKSSTEMVADWSVILIYSSAYVRPKSIYIYDGFSPIWHQLSEIMVSGFEFPADPEIRITLTTHEGDSGLADATHESSTGEQQAFPEGIQVKGETPANWLLLSNECNPPVSLYDSSAHLDYTEVFNSISSVYGYADTNPVCVGGTPPYFNNDEIEYGIDVDTFLIDSNSDTTYISHFLEGGESIYIRIGANQDAVITNYMIVSVSTKADEPDTGDTEIPGDSGDTEVPGDTGDPGDSGDTDTTDTDDPGDPDTGDSGDTGSSDSGDSADTDPTDPEGSTEPKQGEPGAECYPDRTCNDGLLCRSSDNTCFAPEAVKSSGCSVLTLDQDFRM